METRSIIKHKAQTERLVDKCPSSAKIRQIIATNLARQLLIIICLTSRSVFEKSRDCVKSARRLQKALPPSRATGGALYENRELIWSAASQITSTRGIQASGKLKEYHSLFPLTPS